MEVLKNSLMPALVEAGVLEDIDVEAVLQIPRNASPIFMRSQPLAIKQKFQVRYVTSEHAIEGSMVKGAMGLVPISILTLLLITANGLMAEGGLLAALMNWLDQTLARNRRGTEASIVALTSLANLCVSANTVAMITVGPPFLNGNAVPFQSPGLRSYPG